jgi:phospholipase/carboxylesterase/glyoxalase family protein
MAEELAGFKHRFAAGNGQEGPTLLLLHGTGGNENDLLPLGRELLPGANLLSPRGKVLEHGMPRFFRRLAEGVFDEEDLKLRTEELTGFVEEASERYGFDPGELFAVGFSNGANIAASLLLSRPEALRGAVLLRPMVPFEPEEAPDLSGVSIFVAAGELDHLVPKENTARLVELLRDAAAEIQVRWQPTGHGLMREEIEEAKRWLSQAVYDETAGMA